MLLARRSISPTAQFFHEETLGSCNIDDLQKCFLVGSHFASGAIHS